MSKSATSKRVSGHTLWREGFPWDEGHAWTPPGAVGSGKCSCGELSPLLPSDNARKRWHREHKAAVLRALEEET